MMIDVKNVEVEYLIGGLRNTGIKEFVLKAIKREQNTTKFKAIDNINFTIEKGETVGIIGRNGAGKSTLLKVISGVLPPTNGSVECNGIISSLLELGTGFDGDLTVKENIFLRGAVLGYKKQFIIDSCDGIIEFAELEEFKDRQYKYLSSGMKSKLSFAISSLVNPDILILDEVLSVADSVFQKKSEENIKDGVTTLLVTHSIPQVRKMCQKALWIDQGKQVAFGDAEQICDDYEEFLRVIWKERTGRT